MAATQQLDPGFGRRVRFARRTRDWTQFQLSQRLKVSPVYVCRIELGQAPVSPKLRARLTRLLHLDGGGQR
jgi:ribosome-binding protein aMBF1 (putative translation factor)